MAGNRTERQTQETSDNGDTGGLERVVGFSDGVFAIVITLLVLDVKLPNVPPADLGEALRGEWLRQALGYLVSFFVIGSYWYAHFRLFRALRRVDRRFIIGNLAALLFVSFLPATTALFSSYTSQSIAVSAYSANLCAAGLAFTALWVYAARDQRLLRREITERSSGAIGRGFYALALSFAPAILLAFLNPVAAMISWLLALVLPRSAAARYYQQFADEALRSAPLIRDEGDSENGQE